MSDFFTITYDISPSAKKTDYLKNPKGYQIRNFFTQKMLVGVLPKGEDIANVTKEFISLNSRFFPLKRSYLSDEYGLPRRSRTDIIPVNYSPKSADNKSNSSGLIFGALAMIAGYLYFKKGKKRK